MLKHLKNHWKSWAIAFLAIIIFCWVGFASEAFQQCIIKSYYESSDHEPEKGIAQILSTLRWTETCAGEFFREDGEAITAFFTLVLGISTVALWWSTRDLVQGANKTAERELRAYVYLDVTIKRYPLPPAVANRLFGCC
jgi:hypothetical protein